MALKKLLKKKSTLDVLGKYIKYVHPDRYTRVFFRKIDMRIPRSIAVKYANGKLVQCDDVIEIKKTPRLRI